MASARAREQRARDEAEQQCHDWRDSRDADEDEIPENEDDPLPSNLLH